MSWSAPVCECMCMCMCMCMCTCMFMFTLLFLLQEQKKDKDIIMMTMIISLSWSWLWSWSCSCHGHGQEPGQGLGHGCGIDIDLWRYRCRLSEKGKYDIWYNDRLLSVQSYVSNSDIELGPYMPYLWLLDTERLVRRFREFGIISVGDAFLLCCAGTVYIYTDQ